MDEIDLRFIMVHGGKLSFFEYEHGFSACKGLHSRLEGLETQHGFKLLLEADMIRFNAVVQIFGRSVNHFLFQFLGRFQAFNGPMIRLVAIGGDFLWRRVAGFFQRFLKERAARWFILSEGRKKAMLSPLTSTVRL